MFNKKKIEKLQKELNELHEALYGTGIKNGIIMDLLEELRELEKYLGVDYEEKKEFRKITK